MSPSSSPSGREQRRARRDRRRRHDRRRIVDRSRQGARAVAPRADRGRAHDLRRERADDDLRAHRRAAQADRQGPDRAPPRRRVRPRADARPAAVGHRALGVQCPRPFGRGAVGAGLQPDHVGAGARRGAARSPGRCRRRWPTRPMSTHAAICSTARHCRGWRSAQRRPGCTTRSATCSAALQPRPRRRPLRDPPARRRVQRAGAAG